MALSEAQAQVLRMRAAGMTRRKIRYYVAVTPKKAKANELR